MIMATRDAVTCLGDSNSDCELEDGFDKPSPPNLGGKASSCRSKEQGGRPVMAGMKCWWITISKYFSELLYVRNNVSVWWHFAHNS